MNGGEGDDRIVARDLQFDDDRNPLPDAPDTLNGGAGDDFIRADDGDIVTGGDGTDRFCICVNQDPRIVQDSSDAETVTITDFDPDTESVRITLIGGLEFGFDEITAVEAPDGGIVLTAEGIDFLHLQGVSFDQMTPQNLTVRVIEG